MLPDRPPGSFSAGLRGAADSDAGRPALGTTGGELEARERAEEGVLEGFERGSCRV